MRERALHRQFFPLKGCPVHSRICIVIPAFNAGKTLEAVVRGALCYLPSVFVADDGSTDDTAAVAKAAGAQVVRIGKNRGKGNALKTLFRHAFEQGFEAVISMDADGQHDPDEIPKFLAAHEQHPACIIVGSRMSEQDKIPRARYNSMHIARFYMSLFSNQYLEDTQCGFRLYPMASIRDIRLVTEHYVTESEVLMKAGDSGVTIWFVPIRTIYGDHGSHFRPIMDITRITAYVISYGVTKWFIEGLVPDRPNTYLIQPHPRDIISRCRAFDLLYQAITAITAPPMSIFYLIEYSVLSLILRNNFASVRAVGCGYWVITVASNMLPFVPIFGLVETFARKFGLNLRLVDWAITNCYPHVWGKKSKE